MEEKNRSQGWYCSKYNWSNGVTFVKNIGFDLNGLYELYKKRFEKAEGDVMAKCKVASSGDSLSYVSKSSMSPYFIIEYTGEYEV